MITVRTNRLLLILWSLSISAAIHASELPFVRITDILADNSTGNIAQQYIGIEMRTSLFVPETSGPIIFHTQDDGTITISPRDDLPPLAKNSLGLRLQIQYIPDAIMSEVIKRKHYVFLSRDTITSNKPTLLRPLGKAEPRIKLQVRQVMPQNLDIATRIVCVPENARLDFGVALQNDWRIPRGAQVRFKVTAITDTANTTLYEETITRHEPWEPPRWHQRTVNLSDFSNHEVQMVFSTEKMSDNPEMLHAFPLWGNPILYSTAAVPRSETPNIIMIALDTLRADHLGCYGYSRNTSPNIDAFAAANLLFENAFAPAPWTTPSFASIFTGRLPSVHEAGHFRKNYILDATYATLAEHAQNAGMLTAAFTEGIAVRAQLGFSRGFDQYSDGASPLSHKTGTAEDSFRAAAEWMHAYGHLPFLLFVHTYEPHDPYNAPDPWNLMFVDANYTGNNSGAPETAETKEDKQHMRDRYDGSIAYTDHWVGWFIEQVKQKGLLENTVVVLFSDHGEAFWEHDHCGHLQSRYDEVLHVPVILALPTKTKCSKRIEHQIGSADIFATLLDILKIPAKKKLDSHSLMPLINNCDLENTYPRDYVASELRYVDIEQKVQADTQTPVEHLLRSLRGQTRKFITTQDPVDVQSNTTQNTAATAKEELYDMVADPNETNNLADSAPEERDQWRQRFKDFFATFGVDVINNTTNHIPCPESVDQENLEAMKTLGYL